LLVYGTWVSMPSGVGSRIAGIDAKIPLAIEVDPGTAAELRSGMFRAGDRHSQLRWRKRSMV